MCFSTNPDFQIYAFALLTAVALFQAPSDESNTALTSDQTCALVRILLLGIIVMVFACASAGWIFSMSPAADCTVSPTAQLGRFWSDSLVHDEAALQLATDLFGALNFVARHRDW